MTRDEITVLLTERERAFRDSDPDRVSAVYADDAVLVSPLFGTVTGRDAISASHHQLFKVFKDMVIKTEPPIIEGDRGAQAFVGHATHTSELFGVPASGRHFEIQGVFVYHFKDGKIAHERRLYDFTGLLLQLGVLKAKPS
jgi:steroid delta-isomerase-like uncharacterized protein